MVLATDKGLAGLAKAGKVDGDSNKDLGSMGFGVAVKAGAPKPDIHDVDSFKKSMLAAKSIIYANPAKGGSLKSASNNLSHPRSSCVTAAPTA